MFFSVNANGIDASDHAYWQNVLLAATSDTINSSIYTAVEITWPSLPGVNYQVQYRTNLDVGTWEPLGGIVPGSGGLMSAFDSTRTNATRFYRVILADQQEVTRAGSG